MDEVSPTAKELPPDEEVVPTGEENIEDRVKSMKKGPHKDTPPKWTLTVESTFQYKNWKGMYHMNGNVSPNTAFIHKFQPQNAYQIKLKGTFYHSILNNMGNDLLKY